jgi:thioredoxin 1
VSGNVKVLTDNDFEDSLPAGPAVVDFYASWCPHCQAMAPIFEALSGELGGRLEFAKIEVDENTETSTKYKIRSIPCFIVFDQGREVKRIMGEKTRQELKEELKEY